MRPLTLGLKKSRGLYFETRIERERNEWSRNLVFKQRQAASRGRPRVMMDCVLLDGPGNVRESEEIQVGRGQGGGEEGGLSRVAG